ncbi:MAG: hypothetical protein AAGF11_07830 [Myxococcota bacterium]
MLSQRVRLGRGPVLLEKRRRGHQRTTGHPQLARHQARVIDRPTSSAIRGDQLVVVSSQLDHIVDDENGALGTPPDLPFMLVSVPPMGLLED